MTGWSMEKHLERLKWQPENRASFYLAEKRQACFERWIGATTAIIAGLVVMASVGAALLAVW